MYSGPGESGASLSCPRCGSVIGTERQNLGKSIICGCGWVAAPKPSLWEEDGLALIVMTVMSVVMVVAVGYLAKWDNHAFSALSLHLQHLMGSSSTNTHAQMAQICEDRRYSTCAKEHWWQVAELNPQRLEVWKHLGELNARYGDWEGAVKAYSNYFRYQGNDPDVAWNFGRSLEKSGNNQRAKEYFEFALQRLPTERTAGVVRDYVRVLIAEGNWRKAQELILGFRRTHQDADLFLEAELQKIRRSKSVS